MNFKSLMWVVLGTWYAATGMAQDRPTSSADASPAVVDRRLVDAIEGERWSEADRWLDSGADVGASQPDGMTALHWAVYRQNSSLVPRLIEAGANPDAPTLYKVTPLAIACQLGHEPITRQLLAAGADPDRAMAGGETPLMIASRTGAAGVVRALLEHGANVNATEGRRQTALMWAAAEGNLEALDSLIRSGAEIDHELRSGFTALTFAAREGQIEAVRRLVEAGADVNGVMDPANTSGRAPRKGMSPLMLAVESGHFELALVLVDLGADPNDQRSGFAPLHAITWVRKTNRGDGVDGDPPPRGSGTVHSLQFVRELVAAGADVNAKLRRGSGGRAKLNLREATPFLMASKTADLPLMKLLVQLGSDPTIANVDGSTPLMAAAGVGVVAVGEEAGTEPEVLQAIEWLVDLGADPNHVDRNGETAMHGAAYRNYPLAVQLLDRLGADPEVWDRKNKYGWTPELIAAGNRPGSFKPSPETIAALRQAKREDPGTGSTPAPASR